MAAHAFQVSDAADSAATLIKDGVIERDADALVTVTTAAVTTDAQVLSARPHPAASSC